MNRKEALEAAIRCVCVERQNQHGEPENTFAVISDLWEMYLHHKCGLEAPLSPADVAQMMVLFKVARSIANDAHEDNYVDAAGYSALAAELSTGWMKLRMREVS